MNDLLYIFLRKKKSKKIMIFIKPLKKLCLYFTYNLEVRNL